MHHAASCHRTRSPRNRLPWPIACGRAGRALTALGMLMFLFVQIGCAARNAVPEITSAHYDGPPLALDREGTTALAVFTAPTPGWRVSLDRVVEGFKRRDAFITIRPPNPKYQYAQVVVEQRVMTNVPGDVTLRLFARILPWDSPMPSKSAYHPVTASDPMPQAEGSGTPPPPPATAPTPAAEPK